MIDKLTKFYLEKGIAEHLLSNGANLKKEDEHYYVNGWTQGVGGINLYNSNENSTYLCWYDNDDINNPVGIKIKFSQFKTTPFKK